MWLRAPRYAPRGLVTLVTLAGFCWAAAPAEATSTPAIESESVTNVRSTDATLEALINPQEAAPGALYQFQLVREPSEYAPQILCPPQLGPFAGCEGQAAENALPIGFVGHRSQAEPVSLDLADAGVALEPNTTYHYRVLAAHRTFTGDTLVWEEPAVQGQDQTFTTPPRIAIESESASHLTTNDATLEAQINPMSLRHFALFQFQLASSADEYPPGFACPTAGLPADASLCLGLDSEPEALPLRLTETGLKGEAVSMDLATQGIYLQPGTTYHYRVIAARSLRMVGPIQWEEPIFYGADQTFTTPPAPIPVIESESVSHLTATDATVEAQINGKGLETTYAIFVQAQSGCGGGLPCATPVVPIRVASAELPGSSHAQVVSVDLNSAGLSLTPSGTYEVWVEVANAAGSTRGRLQEFTAQPAPAAISTGDLGGPARQTDAQSPSRRRAHGKHHRHAHGLNGNLLRAAGR